jgi:hypothetical protein
MKTDHVASRVMNFTGKTIAGDIFAAVSKDPTVVPTPPRLSAGAVDSGAGFTLNVKCTSEEWIRIRSEIDEAFKRWDDATMVLTVRPAS